MKPVARYQPTISLLLVLTALMFLLHWASCAPITPSPTNESVITGYGEYNLGIQKSTMPTTLNTDTRVEDLSFEGVEAYSIYGEFMTSPNMSESNVPVEIIIYVESGIVGGIEVKFQFTRHLFEYEDTIIDSFERALGLQAGRKVVQFSRWLPETTLINDIKQMVFEKYRDDINNKNITITNEYATLEENGKIPEVYIVLRDKVFNTLVLTWEITGSSNSIDYDIGDDQVGVLYLRYATGEFFDEFWNEGEYQKQIDML